MNPSTYDIFIIMFQSLTGFPLPFSFSSFAKALTRLHSKRNVDEWSHRSHNIHSKDETFRNVVSDVNSNNIYIIIEISENPYQILIISENPLFFTITVKIQQ